MEEDKMKELMIDYLEGNLTGELNEFVARHIEKDGKWQREFEALKSMMEVMDNATALQPDDSLRQNFEAMLKQEMLALSDEAEPKEAKVVKMNNSKTWLQIAAAIAILVVGAIGGIQIARNNNDSELVALKAEMEATKQLVISSLQNQSASSRLNAVNVSFEMSKLDQEIIDVLFNTLNHDDNANVRLAALEALARYADEEAVRKGLIESLSEQDQPVVQIALINLMVKLKEERAIKPLKDIMDSEDALDAVKDEANYGVFKLS